MERQKKLFCEISPLTYQISVVKNKCIRHIQNFLLFEKISRQKQAEPLPMLIYEYKSLIRRKLGNVNHELQENKAVNLGITAPIISGTLIKPGETFSFWKLVGSCASLKEVEGVMKGKGARVLR